MDVVCEVTLGLVFAALVAAFVRTGAVIVGVDVGWLASAAVGVASAATVAYRATR